VRKPLCFPAGTSFGGGATSAFGSSYGAQVAGTAHVKFNPVTGIVPISVGDSDLQDPHVFGPSGSISQSYGSGSFTFLIKLLSGLK
jgi:hypothetical protein